MRRIWKRLTEEIALRGATPVIRAVRKQSLTYLPVAALQDLYDHAVRLENDNVDGIFVEAGCALGGSAIVIATAKSKQRPFNVYDVFGMIPPPSEKDGDDVHERYETIKSGKSRGIGGKKYYGYEEDLLGKVTESFREHGVPVEENNVHLIQGLFQDTMNIDQPVALAHVDGDWYESVMTCLERIEPHVVSGGVLVIDDYEHWSGCRTAVDDYFSDKKDKYEFVIKSRLHILRR